MRLFAFGATAAVLALSVLSACAEIPSLPGVGPPGVQDSLSRLGAFTLTDIRNADAIAVANADSDAHECFGDGQGLSKFVTDQQALIGGAASLTVSGAISTFEAGRVTARGVGQTLAGGVPHYLIHDCAPLVASVRLDAANFLAQLAAFGIKP